MDGKRDAGKRGFHIGRLHPLVRIFRVIIVAVHRQAIAADEVIAAAVVVAVLRANVITTDRSSKCRRTGNLCFVRIGAVAGIADKIGVKYCKHYFCTSSQFSLK